MAKYGSIHFEVLLVDAYNLIASLSNSASMGKESITQQTNPFGASSEEHTPINMEKGVLELGGGIFDAATDALHNVAGSPHGVSRIVSAAIEGNTIGKHFMGFEGALDIIYSVMDKRDGLTMADVKYLISGETNEGVIVQNLASFTADWDTKTGGAGVTDAPVDYTLDLAQTSINIASASKAATCVVTTTKNHKLATGQIIFISGNSLSGPAINGQQTVTVTGATTFTIAVNTSASTGAGTDGQFVLASTTAGGVGYLHCTAFAPTSLVPKIMHSPDDSTYAALITFATLTAVGKERKTVTGTVDRYLSFNGDHTGAGSVTVFSGFCRN
jgi:hypothetical protein